MPALFQAAFKHASLRVFPEEEEIAAFRTSGTTGEGYGVHHFCSLRLYEEAILRGGICWGRRGCRKSSWSPRLPRAAFLAVAYDGDIEGAARAGRSIGASIRTARWSWTVCGGAGGIPHAGQPVLLLGTALAFLHWFEALKGESVALSRGSLAFETGGYKGSGARFPRRRFMRCFHQRLGLAAHDVINEYGMTELSSQCYARGSGCPMWRRVDARDRGESRDGAGSG